MQIREIISNIINSALEGVLNQGREIIGNIGNINTNLEGVLDVDPNSVTLLVIAWCVLLGLGCCTFTDSWRPRAYRLRTVAPTLMVSGGIVGTFWGALIALGHFPQIDDGATSLDVINKLDKVLPAISSAFITTIVGLFFGLLAKLFLRLLPEADQEPLKIEQDAVARLEEIRDAVNGLDKHMAGLADTIHNALIDNLKALMDELRTVIADQLAGQLEQTNKILRAQLSEMLNRIEDALINQFGETFKQFNEATQAIKKWQEDHREQVEQLTEAFETTVQGIIKIREECESIPATMEKLTELLGELDARLQAFADMKKQAEQSFPAIKEHLDTIGRDLQNAASGFAGLESSITQAHKSAQQHIEAVGAQLVSTVEKTRTTVQNATQEMMQDIQQHATDVESQIATTTNQMQNATQEMMQNMQQHATDVESQIATITNQMQDAMKDTVNSVRAKTEQMIEDNEKVFNDYMKQTNNIRNSILERWGEGVISLAQRLVDEIHQATGRQPQ